MADSFPDEPALSYARRYAIIMRAADASVSRPPKAMKILPIRDVFAHVESSLLAVAVGSGVLSEASAIVVAGGERVSVSERSTSLS